MGTSDESLETRGIDSSSDDFGGEDQSDEFDLQTLLSKSVPPSAASTGALSDRPGQHRKLPAPRQRLSTRRWGEDGEAGPPPSAPVLDLGPPLLPVPLARKKSSSLPPALPTARGSSALPKPREGSPSSQGVADAATKEQAPRTSPPRQHRSQYRSRPPLADFESALGTLGATSDDAEDELKIPSWPPTPSTKIDGELEREGSAVEDSAPKARVRKTPPPLPDPDPEPTEVEPDPPTARDVDAADAVESADSADTPNDSDEPGIEDLFGAEAERPIEDVLGIADVVAAKPARPVRRDPPATAERHDKRAPARAPQQSSPRWPRDAVMFVLGLTAAVVLDRLFFADDQPPPRAKPAHVQAPAEATAPSPSSIPAPASSAPLTPQPATSPTVSAPPPTASASASSSASAESAAAEGPPFNAAAATVVLKSAGRAAAACGKRNGKGVGLDVTVTFAPSGHVKDASVGGVYANTQFGRCVAGVMKKAQIPPFGGGDATVTERISIR